MVISRNESNADGCILKRAYQVNVDYPEGFIEKIEASRTKKNMNIGMIVGMALGIATTLGMMSGIIYYIITRNIKRDAAEKREQSDRYVGETKSNYGMQFDEEDESQETSQNNNV